MTLTVKTELRKEYLWAVVEGEFELQSMLHNSDVVLEACEKAKASKVLFDIRAMTGVPTDAERFQHAETATRKYMELWVSGRVKSCQFAYLGNIPQIDPRRFGETVAVNRGLRVKVTDKLGEAFEWLGVEPDMGT